MDNTPAVCTLRLCNAVPRSAKHAARMDRLECSCCHVQPNRAGRAHTHECANHARSPWRGARRHESIVDKGRRIAMLPQWTRRHHVALVSKCLKTRVIRRGCSGCSSSVWLRCRTMRASYNKPLAGESERNEQSASLWHCCVHSVSVRIGRRGNRVGINRVGAIPEKYVRNDCLGAAMLPPTAMVQVKGLQHHPTQRMLHRFVEQPGRNIPCLPHLQGTSARGNPRSHRPDRMGQPIIKAESQATRQTTKPHRRTNPKSKS